MKAKPTPDEPGQDDAVDDPVELLAAEQENREDGCAFRGLLDPRSDEDGCRRHALPGVTRTRHDDRARGVQRRRDESRDGGAPEEREGEQCPGLGFIAVDPAQRTDDDRQRQHGEADADQEAADPGRACLRAEDHEAAGRHQQGEQPDQYSPQGPPSSTYPGLVRKPLVGVAGGRRPRCPGGHGRPDRE